MGGCSAWPWEDRVRLCLEAGHEWLLVCQTPEGRSACAQTVANLPEAQWAPALAATRVMRRHLPRAAAVPFAATTWQAWLTRLQTAATEP